MMIYVIVGVFSFFAGYCLSDCIRFVTLLCDVDALRNEVDSMRWDLLRAKYDIHQVADKLGVTIEQQMEQAESKDK